MKNLLLTFVGLLSLVSLTAQNSWCGTDQYNQELLDNMSIEDAQIAIDNHNRIFEKSHTLKNQKSGTIITIPVVVHVLHDNCEGNITKEQVLDGLRVINEDFRRMNKDTGSTRAIFKPYASDTEIEFKLAQKDPNGNCTEGIVRVNTPSTNDFSNSSKSISFWPSNKYLNIWLVESIYSQSGTILGYAQFPGYGSWNTYGLVVRNDQWGTKGTSNADGRTGTHEIGHCLSLFHTFQSSCGNLCQNSGDRICDTPPVYQSTWSCKQSQNTCSNDTRGNSVYASDVEDQIENYMSYDNCQNMYTLEQKDAMHTTLNDSKFPYLNNLISSGNLVNTGTNPGYVVTDCKPKAAVCQAKVGICEGNTVTYTDLSYNGPIATRLWSFPGGTPASSSDSIVTVTYSNEGIYDATLTVGNSQGNGSKTLKKVVTVHPILADFTSWTYKERFEDQAKFDSLWQVDNTSGGRKWELTSKAAYTGANSVYMNNYINSSDLKDLLISPSYDFSAIVAPRLSFKLAYARKSATSFDFLSVQYSFDCGENWYMLTSLSPSIMESVNGYVTSEFIPADQTEWKEFGFTIPGFVAGKENVRLKFEFTSGGGNNLFVDDLDISSLTGIEDRQQNTHIALYPNPVSGSLNIDLAENESTLESIKVLDLSGRELKVYSEEQLRQNNNGRITLDVSNYVPGLYFLLARSSDGQSIVKKFVVE